MSEKREKDLLEKISDAAAIAGKAIGDEFSKMKLSREIWNLKHDLREMYARVGKIVYKRNRMAGEQTDDELVMIFNDIAELEDTINDVKERKENIDSSCCGSETDAPRAESSVPGKCGECGEMVLPDEDKRQNFCATCGNRLP